MAASANQRNFGISFFVTFIPIVADGTKKEIPYSTKGHSGLSYMYKSTICPTLNPYITVQWALHIQCTYKVRTVCTSQTSNGIFYAQWEGGATGSVCNVPYQQYSSKLALQYYLMTHQRDCTTIAVTCLDGDGYKYGCKPIIDSTRHTKLAGGRPRWGSSRGQCSPRTKRLLRELTMTSSVNNTGNARWSLSSEPSQRFTTQTRLLARSDGWGDQKRLRHHESRARQLAPNPDDPQECLGWGSVVSQSTTSPG